MIMEKSKTKKKQNLEASTIANLNATAAFGDAKVKRELQQVKFENMESTKKLKDLGCISEKIETK